MHTLFVISTADRDDPDLKLHNVAFHQGIHCLQDKNDLQGKNCNFEKKLKPVTP